MLPFDEIQILELKLNEIGKNAMWNSALQILPPDENDGDRPVIVRVTDAKNNQICITRVNGIPILAATSLPNRFTAIEVKFQQRWLATPPNKQCISQIEM